MAEESPRELTRRLALLTDIAGMGALILVLLDYLRPSLLLLPTIAAGGDTPCHYPTAVYVHDHLLPRLRLHGWYPGAYLGHPLLLYYFPLPFLLISALAPALGMPAAFKLGTALGVFLLPLLVYAAFRLMGFRFPGPLLGAASSFVFLLLEENPIWGGTIASTLTGEFCYTYGIGLGVLFLGVAYRFYSRGGGPWVPAAVLAVTALAHGYAVLWAGLSASFFLYASRRPGRTLRWLASVALLAFALVGVWILPLLSDWRWTTPYDDPWITAELRNLLPPLLLALLALAPLGLAGTLLLARRTGGPDHRLLFLLHAAAMGAALAAAAPAMGVIDVRFVPFAQFAACLAGGAALGLVLRRLAGAHLAAFAFVLLAILHGDSGSKVLRHWIEWNYTGLEAKELWPAFRELADRLKGTVADPRVAVEYSKEHERAGSIRMYETLPFFSGRSTLEGVYNQASLQTPAVYYLASELSAVSPNPFRSREYSRFDTEGAIRHLRLFNVREIVALSPQLVEALEARGDVVPVARIGPYALFRIRDPGPGYVEPLAYEPVRSPFRGWREKAYRWFTRKPPSPVHLVFTNDVRFQTIERDEYLPPPALPLPPGVLVKETVEAESLTIETNRVGHPLLVKISYHPRWRAVGADGPYLVSPALMMVVPRQRTVRLVYSRTWADTVGLGPTLGALLLLAARGLARRRKAAVAPAALPTTVLEACEAPRPSRRWGGLIPAGIVLTLVGARLATAPSDAPREREAAGLYERALQAYSTKRFLDAAEYARHALACGPRGELLAGIQTLRGESLLRASRPIEAAQAFEAVIQAGSVPFMPQALFGAGEAHQAAGDMEAAAVARECLMREFADTPWARRLRSAGGSGP